MGKDPRPLQHALPQTQREKAGMRSGESPSKSPFRGSPLTRLIVNRSTYKRLGTVDTKPRRTLYLNTWPPAAPGCLDKEIRCRGTKIRPPCHGHSTTSPPATTAPKHTTVHTISTPLAWQVRSKLRFWVTGISSNWWGLAGGGLAGPRDLLVVIDSAATCLQGT